MFFFGGGESLNTGLKLFYIVGPGCPGVCAIFYFLLFISSQFLRCSLSVRNTLNMELEVDQWIHEVTLQCYAMDIPVGSGRQAGETFPL